MSEQLSIRKTLAELSRHSVKVGINAESAANAYAAAHEYGVISKNIPARSFLRAPLQKHHKEIMSEAVKDIAYLLAKGETSKELLLGNLGRIAVNACKDWIDSEGEGTWQAFSENYKMRPSGHEVDGSSKLLQDTGLLINSIASEVA